MTTASTDVRRILVGLFVALAAWGGPGHAVNCCNVIYEYHNTLLDHYFLAILPAEIAAIDGGKAGPGWVRTGETLITEDFGLYTYGNRVSRFYGSNDIGPNSHFFTLVPAESQMLRQIEANTPAGVPKWHFESFNFPAVVIGPTGCQYPDIYRAPVYRLYNNGVARGIDPNHRYAKRQKVVDEMVAKGWVFEGPVFCVVQ